MYVQVFVFFNKFAFIFIKKNSDSGVKLMPHILAKDFKYCKRKLSLANENESIERKKKCLLRVHT